MTVDDKLKVWQSYYQKLLNVEFPWNASNLSDETPVKGPAFKFTTEMVSKVIKIMKAGKAAGASGIIIEIIKADNKGIINCIKSLFSHIVHKGRVPNDWHLSYNINVVKGKGDALFCGNCRSLELKSSRACSQYYYLRISIC